VPVGGAAVGVGVGALLVPRDLGTVFLFVGEVLVPVLGTVAVVGGKVVMV
jgi:hypothetical protein